MIFDPARLAVFVLGALALLAVPGPAVGLRRRALGPPGPPCRGTRQCSVTGSVYVGLGVATAFVGGED